jgi:hypothetical protein
MSRWLRMRARPIFPPMPDAVPPRDPAPDPSPAPAPRETCDVCGCDELYELRCKVVCRNCRSIVRSCADLA